MLNITFPFQSSGTVLCLVFTTVIRSIHRNTHLKATCTEMAAETMKMIIQLSMLCSAMFIDFNRCGLIADEVIVE